MGFRKFLKSIVKPQPQVIDPRPPIGDGKHATPGPSSSPSSAPSTENHNLSTAGEAVKTALTVLKECLDGVPVPGLKAAVGGVLELIKIFENVTGNREELDRLAGRIMELTAQIELPPGRLPGDPLPTSLQSNATSLVSALNAMAEDAKRASSRSLADRTANHEAYRQMIGNLNVDIDRMILGFTMGTSFRMESKMDIEHRKNQASEDEKLIVGMPHAHARYDDTSTKPSRACHPNTRTDLRQTIGNWIDDESSEHTLFWLCGEVGVGKTTVAHTIAKERDDLNQLGASFFFNRDQPQRRDSLLFTSTLAYQLARFDPQAYQAVVDALRRNPDIVHRNLQEQFSQLVVQPLTCIVKSQSPSRPVLIVIDGLDECNDPVALLDVLPLLTQRDRSHLRILITSRPYAAIVTKFKSSRLFHLTSQSHFRDINSQTLSDDIRAYLEWSLGEIAAEFQYSLPSPWPSTDQVNKLIDMASGLFILASIFDRYIRDQVEGNPSRQLERVLSRKAVRGRSPTAELDSMYDLVLNDVVLSIPKDDMDFARTLLELTLLSSTSFSANEISDVLDCTPDDVQSVLRRMTSVIRLPSEESEAITPFHASFGEYIQDPRRCSVKEFRIEPALSHAEWAAKFLEIFLRAAKDGITGIEYDYTNEPPQKLQIAALELPHHVPLASDPIPAQLQQAKGKFRRDAVRTWIFVLYWATKRKEDERLVKHIKEAGFGTACEIEDGDSLRRSMLKQILDQISLSHIHHSRLTDGGGRTTYGGSRTVDEADLQTFRIKLEWTVGCWTVVSQDYRYHGKMLWQWSKLQDPNIVPLRGIDFEALLELSEQSTIYAPLTSPYPDLRRNWYPSLRKAFQQNSEEAIQTALGIAHALQHLEESGFYGGSMAHFPSQSDFRIEDIVLSKEGKLMIHPLLLVYKDSVDLSPTDVERESLAKRRLVHWIPQQDIGASKMVWEFGCVTYEMMTGEPPLKRYDDLAMGGQMFDDKTTVRRLLSDIQISEDLKGVLQACWEVDMDKRPPIQDIVARLETILEGLRK